MSFVDDAAEVLAGLGIPTVEIFQDFFGLCNKFRLNLWKGALWIAINIMLSKYYTKYHMDSE